MSLKALLSPVKQYFAYDNYHVESFMFTINTKITTGLVMVCCLLVTANQYIGDPIDCFVDKKNVVPRALMDTYCWIHSTFTLPHRVTGPEADNNGHPGIGPVSYEDEVTYHRYYQWVCFTLFFQAILFLSPRLLWQKWEGGQVARLIPDEMVYKPTDGRMHYHPLPPGAPTNSKDQVKMQVRKIQEYLVSMFNTRGIYRYQKYFLRYVFCEFLTLANLVIQIGLIDRFLGGMFTIYGPMVFEISSQDPEDRDDPMNLVFPKVAKCVFRKYGISGTVETHDALCVLPLNILNEKIYIFLWFWLVAMLIFTSLSFAFHLALLCSAQLRAGLLRFKTQNLIGADLAGYITKNVRRGEWFFLLQLGSNLHPIVFSQLCLDIDRALVKKYAVPEPKPTPNGRSIMIPNGEVTAEPLTSSQASRLDEPDNPKEGSQEQPKVISNDAVYVWDKSTIEQVQEAVRDLSSRVEAFKGDTKDREYLCLEESLTQHMLSLDGINANGHEEIRQMRKETITLINLCLSKLEQKLVNTDDTVDKCQQTFPSEAPASQEPANNQERVASGILTDLVMGLDLGAGSSSAADEPDNSRVEKIELNKLV